MKNKKEGKNWLVMTTTKTMTRDECPVEIKRHDEALASWLDVVRGGYSWWWHLVHNKIGWGCKKLVEWEIQTREIISEGGVARRGGAGRCREKGEDGESQDDRKEGISCVTVGRRFTHVGLKHGSMLAPSILNTYNQWWSHKMCIRGQALLKLVALLENMFLSANNHQFWHCS